MELNKIANEKVNKYMARKIKEGYNKFPSALRSLAQTIFPTDGAAGLLEVHSIWVAACAATAGGSMNRRRAGRRAGSAFGFKMCYISTFSSII